MLKIERLIAEATPGPWVNVYGGLPNKEISANSTVVPILFNSAPELVALVKAAENLLIALNAEAKAKNTCDVALENYTNPKTEVDAYSNALWNTSVSISNVRQALASIQRRPEWREE